MDIFAEAIQMEKDGEAYYRQLAHRTGNKGLMAILTMLADEEVKHQKVIAAMPTSAIPVQASGVLTRAKNIFAEIRDSDEPLPDDTSQIELYKHALLLERQSEDFYAALTSGALAEYDAYDESRADFSRWKGIFETWQRRKDAYRTQIQQREVANVIRAPHAQ